VRVVPNKFPAFDGHEVVIHGPSHVRSLVELEAGQIPLIAEAWRSRATAAHEAGFPHFFAGVNEGYLAGASLHHSHSQLIRLREEPPLEAIEHNGGTCRLCEYLAWERSERARVVAEKDGLLLLCPYAGRAPYECLVAPSGHEDDAYESSLLAAGLQLAVEALRRLRAATGPRPLNLWLHPGGHWHIELLPRLTTFAAIELGTGHYVNSLPPEEAAATLRG
jgi:UDPglucose--hexose-1-phosphate uridylyltransferase